MVFILVWRPSVSFPIFYLVEAILSTFESAYGVCGGEKSRKRGNENERTEEKEKREKGTRESAGFRLF